MRQLCLLLALTATSGAVAQSVFNDPDVIVPKTTMVHSGEKPGTVHTEYVRYVGIWRGIHTEEPFPEVLSGPALQSIPGYHPADIYAAYNYPAGRGYGAIAVVLWDDQPNILSDFNTFSSAFGLPAESSTDRTSSSNKVFQVVYANGTPPPPDPDAGGEESLDVEWTHAMAPNAKIYLVEAASGSTSDLMVAEQVAASLPGVHEVSNSWISYGGFSGEQQDDVNFTAKNILYLAGSGDLPGVHGWPSESPNVISCGGTTLNLSNDVVTSETGWNSSGGGKSNFESIPAFQASVAGIVGNVRGTPDISSVADPATGVAVYDSYGAGGWIVVGGTSVATPVCAGMLNGRQYVEANSAAYLTRIYGLKENATYLRDITSGSSGSNVCTVGWDFVTGNGSIKNILPPPIANVPFTPVSAAAYPNATQLRNGTTQSLAATDGNTFRVSSIPQSGLGQVAGISASYTAKFSGSLANAAVASASLVLDGSSPAAAATGVWFYNWKTGAYDYQTSVRLAPGGTSLSLAITNIASYFNASNQFKAIIRSIVPSNFGSVPSAYTLSVDQMSLSATPVQG